MANQRTTRHWLSAFPLALAAASALGGALAGCAEGRPAPDPTKMVEIRDTEPFTFGMGELGCGIPQSTEECDTKTSFVAGQPAIPVQLKPFALDVHEVTVEQYRYCEEMGACSLPAGDNGPPGITDVYYTNEKYNKYPVILVRWSQAAEYCRFVGKRLPTEYEWERVAGGAAKTAAQKRVFTWMPEVLGYQPELKDCKGANVNLKLCNGGAAQTREVMTSEDDAVSEGGGKVYDLAGNVAEYTASDYVEQLTCDASQPYTCSDCLQCLKNKKRELCESVCQPCACGSDSTPEAKPNCYQPCGTPICAKPPAGAAPIDGAYTGKNTAQRRMVRGGSYAEAPHGCDGRSDTRLLSVKPTDQPLLSVGFRCAKSL